MYKAAFWTLLALVVLAAVGSTLRGKSTFDNLSTRCKRELVQ